MLRRKLSPHKVNKVVDYTDLTYSGFWNKSEVINEGSLHFRGIQFRLKIVHSFHELIWKQYLFMLLLPPDVFLIFLITQENKKEIVQLDSLETNSFYFTDSSSKAGESFNARSRSSEESWAAFLAVCQHKDWNLNDPQRPEPIWMFTPRSNKTITSWRCPLSTSVPSNKCFAQQCALSTLSIHLYSKSHYCPKRRGRLFSQKHTGNCRRLSRIQQMFLV